MTWFTASVLIAIKSESRADGPFLVYENMYLLEASSALEASSKAEKFGQGEMLIDDGLTINGERASRSFVGIRKLISVSNPEPLDQDEDRPVSGTEVTYALYEVADEKALKKLAKGEKVKITYLE